MKSDWSDIDMRDINIFSVSLAQPSLADKTNLGLIHILCKISISAEARLLLHLLKCVSECLSVCLSVLLIKDKLTKHNISAATDRILLKF